MGKMTIRFMAVTLVMLLAACGAGQPAENTAEENARATREAAPIPAEYTGKTNPAPDDAASIDRGQKVYTSNCQTCHGQKGLGEGSTGSVLQPPASPIAQTSQTLPDDYLFWRISEGGAQEPFNSAMPSWKNILSEQDIWDVINYVRSLGKK
jgi:mono/diheme cytochrome c family protein